MPSQIVENGYSKDVAGDVGLDTNLLIESIAADFPVTPFEVGTETTVTFDTVFEGVILETDVIYLGTDAPLTPVPPRNPGSILFGGALEIQASYNDLVDLVNDPANADAILTHGEILEVGFDIEDFTRFVNGQFAVDQNSFLKATYVVTELTYTAGADCPPVNSVPYCFAAGSLIATPRGGVPVERLLGRRHRAAERRTLRARETDRTANGRSIVYPGRAFSAGSDLGRCALRVCPPYRPHLDARSRRHRCRHSCERGRSCERVHDHHPGKW